MNQEIIVGTAVTVVVMLIAKFQAKEKLQTRLRGLAVGIARVIEIALFRVLPPKSEEQFEESVVITILETVSDFCNEITKHLRKNNGITK